MAAFIPLLRRGAAALVVLAAGVFATPNLHAQEWGEIANISATLGVSDSRICIGEASRGDIGCPSFAPTISSTGRINASAGLTVNSVSLTTAGTTWGYLGSTASYLPTINTSAISATAVQISSNTAVTCGTGNAGTLRYNNSNTSLELCTGTGWQMMGVGIPAGTISAFASTTCPTGWSEYTPARGRFLRGIDNGAGNDADGTRAPGATQTDLVANHAHYLRAMQNGDYANYGTGGGFGGWGIAPATANNQGLYRLQAGNESSSSHNIGTGAETRPKNVAVTYCQFNGTSNGWNNPLSGGSTVPGGSTGQIQYNTSGSFDGNAGLTWTNANQLLTATNISASTLTINGVSITGNVSGDRLTSGTLNITANGTNSSVSLTTSSTTWGYLGSTASYLPNLSSNAISTTSLSVNGMAITSASLISGTAVSFSVNKNNTNQALAAATWTKLTWSTEEFDTNNNFASSRFTPTVAGKYIITAGLLCTNGSGACHIAIAKNGVYMFQSYNADSDPATNTSGIVDMNGTTDYIEIFALLNNASSSVRGDQKYTYFTGALLSSVGGTSSAGATALSGLTDVALSGPATGQVLTYNGTAWVNTTPASTSITTISGTTSMVNGWPDAIVCTLSGVAYTRYYYLSESPSGGNDYYIYRSFEFGVTSNVVHNTFRYNADGSFYDFSSSNGNYTGGGSCANKSISQLYAEGKAFNFIGNSGVGGNGDRLTSGTLSVTANSSSTTVSLTTNGTTWGYLGSTASYLPNLSTNALNVGGLNITSSTLVSTSAQVVFNVDKNGTNQTVTAGADTKLTWARENIDTNSNFDLATNRFTPTVAGYYFFQLEVTCNNTASGYCGAFIYKNGGSTIRGYSRDASAHTNVAHVLYMNGTTDYVEAYGINLDATTILGEAINTSFRGFLLNGGGGSGGSGVSTLSALTDVSATSPADNSLLLYNSSTSKWEAKSGTGSYFQVYGTATLSSGYIINFSTVAANNGSAFNNTTGTFTAPQAGVYVFAASALTASGANTSLYINVNGTSRNGQYMHGTASDLNNATVNYVTYLNAGDTVRVAASGTLHSNAWHSFSGYMVGPTIGSGSGGATALTGLSDVSLTSPVTGNVLTYNGTNWVNSAGSSGDRLTSGTTSVIAQTGGTVAVTAPVQVSGSINFSNNPNEACNASNYGSLKQVNGRIVLCRQ